MRFLTALFLWSIPLVCHAKLDTSDWGFNLSVSEIVDNLVFALQATIVPVGITCFIGGAFYYIIGGDQEDQKNKGKEFMIGGLIGVGVVLGAKAILNLAIYFIYGAN